MPNTVINSAVSTRVDIFSNEFYINKSLAMHDTSADPFGYGVRVNGEDHYLRIDGDLTALVWAIDLATSNAVDTTIRVTSGGSLNATSANAATIGSSLSQVTQANQIGPDIYNAGSITSAGDSAINLNFNLTSVRNLSGGEITGASNAIILGNGSTVINDGVITSNGGWAIKSNQGSTIRNRVDGEIYHNLDNGSAIEIGGQSGFEGQIYNEGYLYSELGNGVVSTTGKIYNYGTIEAGSTGVIASGVIAEDFLSNSGTIEGGSYSIDAQNAFKLRAYNSGDLDGDVRFGSGNDTLGNSGTITGDISMGDGNDRLDNRGGTITESVLSVVDMGDGDDTFLGSSGTRARIEGGAGNDRFYGGDDRDTFVGGSGDDIFFTGAGIDSVRAGQGNDRLYGEGSEVNILFGGADNDIIFGGSGDDIISGGDASPIDFSAGIENEGVDRIYAGDGNDQIHGDGGNDFIYGGNGDDFIIGGYGDDRLYGQDGNDEFLRDFGNDFIVGGAGTDEVSYTNFDSSEFLIQKDAATGVVTVSAQSQSALLLGTDTLVGIEFLIFDDVIIDVAAL